VRRETIITLNFTHHASRFKIMYKKLLIIFIFSLTIMLFFPSQARADLKSYLEKEEPDYRWEKTKELTVTDGKVYELHLVSQRWQKTLWTHRVQIFYPDRIISPDYCTIFVAGKSGKSLVDSFGMDITKSCGTVVVVLWNIPNQPFEGKKEDALMAYTFLKFMETDDQSWPLLFPMTKSVLKCMDSIQEFTTKEGLKPVDNFIIGGVSKRGWTTWLAGASQDKRVRAIIPMVIDTLNIEKQIPHQIEVYGKASDKIHDYNDSGVLDKLNIEKGKKLLQMIDPYNYREKLTLPKLIINGTNDPYWTVDSLNLYWDELKGSKWILYVPNSSHSLEDFGRVINTATSFINTVASKKDFPEITWEFKNLKNGIGLNIKSNIIPESVNIFKASSSSKDFRKAKWISESAIQKNEVYTGYIENPSTGFWAIFGEVNYEINGKVFSISTQIKITERN